MYRAMALACRYLTIDLNQRLTNRYWRKKDRKIYTSEDVLPACLLLNILLRQFAIQLQLLLKTAVDRLYINSGRGLISIQDCVESKWRILKEYLANSDEDLLRYMAQNMDICVEIVIN